MIVEQGFRIFLRSVMSISLLMSLRAISLIRGATTSRQSLPS